MNCLVINWISFRYKVAVKTSQHGYLCAGRVAKDQPHNTPIQMHPRGNLDFLLFEEPDPSLHDSKVRLLLVGPQYSTVMILVVES